MTSLSKLVENLRETTGCGINDCKRALKYNDNDLHKSYEWLKNPYRSWEHNTIIRLQKTINDSIKLIEAKDYQQAYNILMEAKDKNE